MPDAPRLPLQEDYTPKLVGYASQGMGPKLPPGDLEKHFSKKTSYAEKFAYLWDCPLTHEVIQVEPEFTGKDQVKAAEFREKGNAYFKKRSYLSAMESYNQAIIHAKQAVGEGEENELALAYNNRSAALCHMKKYEMCLRDIEMAAENGYPQEQLYKLYERKGKCFQALNQKTQAIESYRKAQEYLLNAKLEEKQLDRWTNDLAKALESVEAMPDKDGDPKAQQRDYNKEAVFGGFGNYSKSQINSYDINKLPKISYRAHECYAGASNVLDFKYTEEKGRHPVAKHDIAIGDTLVMEKPFAAVLLPEYYMDHCYHCLARVVALIPCTQCVNVVYCSTQCQREDWLAFHRYECSYFVLFVKDWCGRIGHLANRMVLQTGMETLLNYYKNSHQSDSKSELEAGLSKEGKYESDISALMNLESNPKERNQYSNFEFTLFAVFLTKVLKVSGFLKDQSSLNVDFESEENLKCLGAVVLQFLQAIQCNSKPIKEAMSPTDFESIKPAEIGVGMYTTMALINHDCYPNTELVFYGNKISVRATRMIFEGEEITCTYGPTFYCTSKFKRMKVLNETYFFACQCTACRDNWPLWRDIESEYPEFRCSNCHRNCDIANLQDKTLTCEVCSYKMDMNEGWGRLTVSHESYAKAIEDAFHLHIDSALPRLAQHLTLMQKYLRMPWKDMLICEAAVQNCYRLMGNKKIQFAV